MKSYLITRPEPKAQQLAEMLQARGSQALVFPTIRIEPVDGVISLTGFDIALFISPNAVACALPLDLDSKTKIAAIGQGTATALKHAGSAVDYVPTEQFNSEALLALAPFQAEAVRGKKIVLVKGQGGRELLAQSLKERGAEVQEAVVYRRIKPVLPAAILADWQKTPLEAIICTSVESLNNLVEMVGSQAHAWLKQQQLLVISPAMVEWVQQHQFTKPPLVAANASNEAIMQSLKP